MSHHLGHKKQKEMKAAWSKKKEVFSINLMKMSLDGLQIEGEENLTQSEGKKFKME